MGGTVFTDVIRFLQLWHCLAAMNVETGKNLGWGWGWLVSTVLYGNNQISVTLALSCSGGGRDRKDFQRHLS